MLLSLMLVAGLTSGLQAPSERGGAITLRGVRSMDASIRATIDEGCDRSPTFAALVDDLERSSFIVYVEQVINLRDGMRGTLLHGGTGPQYLRVLLKRGMSLEDRVVVLAHELQHAGRSWRPVSSPTRWRWTRCSGGSEMNDRLVKMRQQYETAAALQVGDTVVADLRARRGAGVASVIAVQAKLETSDLSLLSLYLASV